MQTLESLKLSAEEAKSIVASAPVRPDDVAAKEVYWHYGISKYFTQGRRNNARIYSDTGSWQTAARYNEELDSLKDRFIKLSDLEALIK